MSPKVDMIYPAAKAGLIGTKLGTRIYFLQSVLVKVKVRGQRSEVLVAAKTAVDC